MFQKRVLIIVRSFPPTIGGGAFRPFQFARFLPEFGWKPVILCAEPTSNDNYDDEILAKLPSDVIVERVGGLQPSDLDRYLRIVWNILWKIRLRSLARRIEPQKIFGHMLPDSHILWARRVYKVAKKLISLYQPQVIFVSSPPHSVQLTGLSLHKLTGLPLIADFRDPWTLNPFITAFCTPAQLQKHTYWEQQVLQSASRVILVTDAMTKQLKSTVPPTVANKLITITNGFDPDDFDPEKLPSSDGGSKQFCIVYTGSLYDFRDATHFLKSVEELVRTNQILENSLKVIFAGPDGTGTLAPYYDRPWFHHHQRVSRREAMAICRSAHVLLLLIPKQIPYAHSSKLFDYLAVGRTILALAPLDSEASRVVLDTRSGVVVPPDDRGGISSALLHLYQQWKRNNLFIVQENIHEFNFRTLTLKLAKVLDSLLSTNL